MKLQFRDSARMTRPAPRRRTRDDNTIGANMGKLGGGDLPNLNQATPAGDVSAPTWAGNTTHVASYPPAHQVDSSGGAYITKQDADGFHVGFMHGTSWDAGGTTNSGLKMPRMTPGGGATEDATLGAEPIDNRPRVENRAGQVAGYVGSRVSPPPAQPGTQDGANLGRFANLTLVKMNRAAAKARATQDNWGSETSPVTTDGSSLIQQMNTKAQAAWKGRS